MVRPEIRKVEDLKGKKIGISSLGSAGDLFFGYVLRKYGIDTDREIFWLAVGNTGERLQALLTGAVDAADLTYPADVAGGAQRLSPFARCAQRNRLSDRVGGDAAQNDSRRARHGDALGAFLCRRHRLFEAEQRIQPESAWPNIAGPTIRSIWKALTHLQGRFHFRALSDHQRIGRDLRDRRGREDRRSATHKPEEFVDTSFVAELDKSGFIKKLYDQK